MAPPDHLLIVKPVENLALMSPPAFYAACSCGWEGETHTAHPRGRGKGRIGPRMARGFARQDALRHHRETV